MTASQIRTYECGCAYCDELNGPPCAVIRNLELQVADLAATLEKVTRALYWINRAATAVEE